MKRLFAVSARRSVYVLKSDRLLEWIERATGNLAKAEELATRGLQFGEKAKWQQGVADAYSSLGLIYDTQGDL